jgi:hypothetical protein
MPGLKSLAQELQSKGRNGDTILAHINPQEAGILKALGGSGTINPATGLPEYGFFKSVANVVAAPFRAVNEVVKAIPVIGPAIDKGLVGLDKAVGSAIPGGWNTLAQTALAFTPIGLPAKVGLAALGGSGAFGKQGKFNLQRALMSGAMAYGMNQLTSGLQNADIAAPNAVDVASSLGEGASSAPGSQAAMLADLTGPGFGSTGGVASSAGYAGVPSPAADIDVFSGLAGAKPEAAPLVFDKSLASSVPQSLQMPSLSSVGTGTMENLAAAGRGITNLSGFGPVGMGEAASAFAEPVTTKGMAALGMGAMGLSALDEQQKFLDQQLASGSIAQEEYDANTARINASRQRSEDAVRANPYQFAAGGQVDDEMGGDYTAQGMDQGNMQKGLFGKGYAAGGQIDMGNGYNPFANLPTMSGPLGAAGQQTAQTQPSFAQSPYGPADPSTYTTTTADMMGGNKNRVSGGLSGILSDFGGITHPINSSTANATPQPLGGQFAHNQMPPQVPTGPIFNSSTYQSTGMGPNSGFSSGTYPGGYGGGGGNGGAFPLEGQYGIVKMAAGGMTDNTFNNGFNPFPSLPNTSNPISMAAGGMPPRFLSGGGDGMSDSIKASINDKQEARLADGEFVIPADVVSHLGNGSSKAGAKQLYSMMDRVRSARTGRKSQGKQINPRKYMTA